MILLAVQALVGHRDGHAGTLFCNPVCKSLKATLGQYGKVAQFVGSHNVQAVTAVTGATKNPRYPLPLSRYRHTEEDVRVFPS